LPLVLKVVEVKLNNPTSKPEEIVDRMRQVRSSGLEHAGQLHVDARQLVDWKSYARARPLISVAVVSLIGFGAFRKWAVAGPSKSTLTTPSKQPTSPGIQIPKGWRSSAIAVISQIAQATLKKHLLNLVQREIFERNFHDQSANSNAKPHLLRTSSTSNGGTARSD